MQKKKFVTILLSVVLFIAIAVLGVANVYRVDSVSLVASTISAEAKEEAKELQKRLNEIYMGGNTLFVDEKAAEVVLDDFPYFRITAFQRQFPNHLVVEAKEDEEVFAVRDGDGYYILGLDGIVLGHRNTIENRSDGIPNVLVTGVTTGGQSGGKATGGAAVDGFVTIGKTMASIEGMGGGIRSNVLEIEIAPLASDTTCMIIRMKEGVTAYVYDYETDSVEKATKLTNLYLSLSDQQKLTGKITVTWTVNGITALYSND